MPVTDIVERYTITIYTARCGCGGYAEYEVGEELHELEPHCKVCMHDAVDNDIPVLVRKIW